MRWLRRRPQEHTTTVFRPPSRPGRHRRLEPAEVVRRQEETGRRWLRRARRLTYVAVVGALALGAWWLYQQSPLLSITRVTVEGTRYLDAEELAAVSGLEGQNILRVDTSVAHDRLLALPLVKSVSFERQWPRAMRITIEERRPWAFWEVRGRRLVVDDEGYVLERVLPDEGAPLIVQVSVTDAPSAGDRVDPDAVQLARRLIDEAPAALGRKVSSLEFRAQDGVTAEFDDGLRVKFGDGRDFEYKLTAVAALLAKSEVEDIAFNTIDVRFGARLSYE